MKIILKGIIFGLCYAVVCPITAIALIEKWTFKGAGIFYFFGQLLSLIPGKPGSLLRGAYYLHNIDKCSWECTIGFGSFFSHRGVSIGRKVTIGAYAVIGCASIGDEALIASRVSITSGKRQHIDDDGNRMLETVLTKVNIGKGCWIGEGAIIMADVGEGSIVGAGTVVTHNIPSNTIIVGNPGRALKGPER